MIDKKKKNKINFGINDFFTFFEGLDLSINFSILVFLASYFLPFLDIRFSILTISSLILLSFTSRFLGIKFSNFVQNTKIANLNIFLFFIFAYILPISVQSYFPIMLSISIFIVSRIIIGIMFSLCYNNLLINNQNFSSNIFSIKYWLFYSLGLFLGAIMFVFINEIFSNDYLNTGGWKVMYILMFTILFLTYLFSNFVLKTNIQFNHKFNIEEKLNSISLSFNSLIILIPLIFFLIVVSSNWLPKFANPENLYFLSYDLVYLFITILVFIFIAPLAKLIGKRNSIIFFNLSIVIISLITSLIDHSSSYSIDFLKFFISLISSFSICCFILQLESKRMFGGNVISILNASLFLISILLPALFYYFIFYTINYSIVYIVFALIYFINYICFFYIKNG